jgi:two-component system, LytTR family, sensor kinase
MPRRLLTAVALVAFWLLPGAVTSAVNISLFPEIVREGFAARHVAGQVTLWLIWAGLTPLIALATRRFPLERGRLRSSLGGHLAAWAFCLTAYLVWAPLVGRLTTTSEMMREESFSMLIMSQLGARATLASLLYAAIVGVTIAFDERQRRTARELVNARLEADLARANLQALQTQLQPHFLFNTLHAIGMLVQEDPVTASRTITQLGDLLRKTLSLADVPEITLAEELAILRDYLRIEETRFGDRLTVSIDAPDDVLRLHVPSLILQPLVENSVRHGVAPRSEPGRIAVRARRSGDSLELEVEDDGPGFDDASSRSTGVGLGSTQGRIDLLYGDAAALEREEGQDGGALVRLRIPARG